MPTDSLATADRDKEDADEGDPVPKEPEEPLPTSNAQISHDRCAGIVNCRVVSFQLFRQARV